MTELITVSHEDHILRLLLNRPEKKNAFTQEMYAVLADAIEDAENNPSVRVIMITGAEGCFSSGNDVKDFLRPGPEGQELPVKRFLVSLLRSTVPILAAVDGLAIGIGTTLLLHCDIVLATARTRFQLPFVNIGLVPEAGSSYLLPRMLGHARASELIMTGRPFTGDEALQMGIVSRLCEPDELAAVARSTAETVAKQPPKALRASKKLLKGDPRGLEAAFQAELKAFDAGLKSAEFAEALQAFKEKRKPNFG